MKNKIAVTYEITLDTDLINEHLSKAYGMTEADIKQDLLKYGVNSCYAIDAEIIDVSERKERES